MSARLLSTDLDAGWHPCKPQVDVVASHRDAFPTEELALPPSHRDATVGADHAMPREPLLCGSKNATDQAGCFRFDVAVGAHKSDRNRSHAGDYALGARVEARLGDARSSLPVQHAARVGAVGLAVVVVCEVVMLSI